MTFHADADESAQPNIPPPPPSHTQTPTYTVEELLTCLCLSD